MPCNAPQGHTCHEIQAGDTWETIATQYGLLPADRGAEYLRAQNESHFGSFLTDLPGATSIQYIQPFNTEPETTNVIYVPVVNGEVYLVPDPSTPHQYKMADASDFGGADNLTFISQLPINVNDYDGAFYLENPPETQFTREQLELISQYDPNQPTIRWLMNQSGQWATTPAYYSFRLEGNLSELESIVANEMINDIASLVPQLAEYDAIYGSLGLTYDEVRESLLKEYTTGIITIEDLSRIAQDISSDAFQILPLTGQMLTTKDPITGETTYHQLQPGERWEYLQDGSIGIFAADATEPHTILEGAQPFTGLIDSLPDDEAASLRALQQARTTAGLLEVTATDYLYAAELAKDLARIESWHLDLQARLLNELDSIIDEIPDMVLGIPTSPIQLAFRIFYGIALENYLTMRVFEQIQ